MVNTTWYTEPSASDLSGGWNFFRWINAITGGLFFPVVLLVIWIICFVAMLFSGNSQSPSGSKAWTFASFISSVLSILLVVAELMAKEWMYASFVLLGIGVVWAILENGR